MPDNIAQFLVNCFAKAAEIPSASIDHKKSLLSYGIDSIITYEIIAEVRERYKVDLPLSVLTDSPSIEKISAFIAARLGRTKV